MFGWNGGIEENYGVSHHKRYDLWFYIFEKIKGAGWENMNMGKILEKGGEMVIFEW